MAEIFMELSFIPPRFCVYQNADRSYQAMALDIIRARIESDYPEGSREVFIDCQSPAVEKWANKMEMGQFITEVGSLLGRSKYFVQPLPEDPPDEYSIYAYTASILFKLYEYIVYEPDIRKDYFQNLKDNMLKGMDVNPYIDEKGLRASLGLSEDKPLPELPPFPHYEVLAVPGTELVMKQLTLLVSTKQDILGKTRSDEVKAQLIIDSHLVVTDLVDLQIQISELTKNPEQSLSEMFDAYEETTPFVYQVYQRYVKEYDTPEKQKQFSFIKFFRRHPSVIYLTSARALFMPFDEQNVFADIFKQYNEYQACIESVSSCERREDKVAFIHLIRNTVLLFVQSSQSEEPEN